MRPGERCGTPDSRRPIDCRDALHCQARSAPNASRTRLGRPARPRAVGLWSMPAKIGAPVFAAVTCPALNSKRRKCTDEVFSSFSRPGPRRRLHRPCRIRPRAPSTVLDTFQLRQRGFASAGSGYRSAASLSSSAVRDQRVIRAKFVRNAFGLEDALDAQHLLHLVLHGQAIFEQEGRIRPDLQRAPLLVRDPAAGTRRCFEYCSRLKRSSGRSLS